MAKTIVGLILLAAVVGFLAYTNPTAEEFKLHIRESVAAGVPASNIVGQVKQRVVSEAAAIQAEQTLLRQDYFVFSIFTYREGLVEPVPARYLGLVHHFIRLK